MEVDTSFQLVQLIHPLHWQDIMLVNERWLLLIAEDMHVLALCVEIELLVD